MKKYHLSSMVLLLSFILLSNIIKAQGHDELRLEDIYNNRVYTQERFGPLRWMKDSKGYSTLEINEETGTADIVRYEAGSGERTVLISTRQLIPEGK